MDGGRAELRSKLERLLEEVATVSVALSRADGTIKGVPHYSVIEDHAHQLGRHLSCLVQVRQAQNVVTSQPRRHRCPHCQAICDVEISDRKLTSIDGDVTMSELVGHCHECRRDFFPSARNAGPRCP